ncbi:hypothetical protein NE237_012635 [Protea cynaroides]|uniref:Uncharacterized protein n=1 Tax=Protea cynaroides TaxID=273540 RepID=A0A9Q0GX74_9MAGN|nr:hypothetical protein NE237_012635 [Protea cynaroides]
MDLVPQQRMENGLNSQMVFQDEALQFSGRKTREVSDFVDEKMFSVGRDRFFRSALGADFCRSIFDSSPGRQEQPENQNWNNGDGSTGTPSGEGSEGEEEDDDEEDEVDEVDGEVEGLVAVDDGNNKNNNNSSNLHNSSEKLRNKKTNLQKHHSSFGMRVQYISSSVLTYKVLSYGVFMFYSGFYVENRFRQGSIAEGR